MSGICWIHENWELSTRGDIVYDFQRYNWIDVEKYAEELFWNCPFEIFWAEDMWNLLMFNEPVDSSIKESRVLNACEIGECILWLLSMQDLFYDYKVSLDLEPISKPGISEYFATYNKCYYEEISMFIGNGDFADFSNIYNNLDKIEEYIEGIIQERKEYIIRLISNYFLEPLHILEFFSGQHFVKNYYENEHQTRRECFIRSIKDCAKQIVEMGESYIADEFDDLSKEMASRIEALRNEEEKIQSMKSIEFDGLPLHDVFNGYAAEAYNWIIEVF